MKYFYADDDTAVLFAANGSALAGLLVGITEIVPLLDFPVPTLPMWLYLCGLVFAFLSKAMIQLTNSDIRQREKLQSGRDFLMEAQKNLDLDPVLSEQFQVAWDQLDSQYQKLLKVENIPTINAVRAIAFFLSALCFLSATSYLIYLAGYLEK